MIYSRLSLVVLIILIIFTLKGVWNIYLKYNESAENRQNIEEHLADVSLREGFLTSEIARLKTKEGIEREIREKFNVKKEGEEVAVIVTPDEKTGAVVNSGSFSLWRSLKEFFTRD